MTNKRLQTFSIRDPRHGDFTRLTLLLIVKDRHSILWQLCKGIFSINKPTV